MWADGARAIRARGAVVLLRDESVVLIARVRRSKTYYLFSGGTVEPSEQALKKA